MSTHDIESTLRERLRRAIDRVVPGPSSVDQVMRAVAGAASSRHHPSGFRLRAGHGFGVVLVASLVVLLVGGALGLSLTLRNHPTTGGSHGQPAGPPLPVPTPTPAAPSPSPSPSPGIAPCDGDALSANFANYTGAAGTLGGDIVLHNSGAVPCTLNGYANLQGYANGQTTQLGVTHSAGGTLLNNNNGTLPTVQLVTLQPGQDAYVAVEYSDVPSSSAPCPSYTTLLITPPEGQHAVTMTPHPFMLCGGFGAAIWIDEAPVSLTAYFAQSS